MFPSSAFWAEMALAKRWALERNQRRQKMLRMSKTESSTFPGGDRLSFTPPSPAAQSVLPGVTGGGLIAMRLSCGTGERMCSTSEGEDMGVKSKESELRWMTHTRDTRGGTQSCSTRGYPSLGSASPARHHPQASLPEHLQKAVLPRESSQPAHKARCARTARGCCSSWSRRRVRLSEASHTVTAPMGRPRCHTCQIWTQE